MIPCDKGDIEKPICVAPTADVCGEGPVWHASEEALYWTDINRFLIHRLHAKSHSVQSWFFDEPVTALALTESDDTLAVVLGSKVVFWKATSDAVRDTGFRLNDWPAVRLNDARADPRGSLWVGSMRNNVGPDGLSFEAGGTDGVLYRLDPDGTATEWKRNIGISNTLVWNPEATAFYFADSLANAIYRYDYDRTQGSISNERIFFESSPRGLPDGSSMDAEGYLWNCRYGGSCIIRIAPDGSVDRVIEMPTANLTSCTFGGPDRKTLYVTSAAANASPAAGRWAGGLFSLRTRVPGLPENRVRFSAFSDDERLS
jgi:sugar lactone lactonase YvrE